jgi:hypothetical protein
MKAALLFLLLGIWSCSSNPSSEEADIRAELQSLSESEYPDNPDRPLRHPAYEGYTFHQIQFHQQDSTQFSIELQSNNRGDTIIIPSVDLAAWMPRLQKRLLANEYMSSIGIVNQEWNRHQVELRPGQFEVHGNQQRPIARVDLARNCLNSYLWEVIVYEEVDGHEAPIHHSWFDFPNDLYKELFNSINPRPFENYASSLVNWEDPENQTVSLNHLRTTTPAVNLPIDVRNNSTYPLKGERKKKFSNIIYPENSNYIKDFLTDSTLFATFTPPGIYTRADPRTTELGRLARPHQSTGSIWKAIEEDTLIELTIEYDKDTKGRQTQWIISGIRPGDIPRLKTEHAHHGWQRPMGFGNHSFYETYEQARSFPAETEPYFSILTDEEGRWLDSHQVGIDGPLLHWDAKHPHLLHIWVLSFERHALVGHYIVDTSPFLDRQPPPLQEHICLQTIPFTRPYISTSSQEAG